jgi:hypothetical protein
MSTESNNDLAARQGIVVDDSDPLVLAQAIDLAFNYRGDVTISRRGDDTVTGYIFDRVAGDTPDVSSVRVLIKDTDDRVRISYNEITQLSFSGRDTAEGRSFDSWMKKYVEKKLAGEEASIESESMDE